MSQLDLSTDKRKNPRTQIIRDKIRKTLLGVKHPKKRVEANRCSHTGLKATITTRLKMSVSQRRRVKEGRHNTYAGGITPINAKIRNSFEYKLWREAVFIRDDYICRFCGVRGGQIAADHIKPFSLFPELRFAIDNGRVLCVDCHKKTDTYCGKVQSYGA